MSNAALFESLKDSLTIIAKTHYDLIPLTSAPYFKLSLRSTRNLVERLTPGSIWLVHPRLLNRKGWIDAGPRFADHCLHATGNRLGPLDRIAARS